MQVSGRGESLLARPGVHCPEWAGTAGLLLAHLTGRAHHDHTWGSPLSGT